MSFFGDLRHTPAATKPPGTATAHGGARVPMQNLSAVQDRVDSVQKLLSDSLNTNTVLRKDEMERISGEISAALRQIISNGAELISAAAAGEESEEIIELDAVELMAEHIHFCEICGKGFKRHANLRMHMRAHGDRFKSPEALQKSENSRSRFESKRGQNARFSCPFTGCPRNKSHLKFRPLKSAICVKNHFRRSHCPKMYSCNKCNKKSYSVMADLKSHMKQCGISKWKCSCRTSFSRKDKLFGHIALFEGHMPAVEGGEVKKNAEIDVKNSQSDNNNLLDTFLDEFSSLENYCFQDVEMDSFFSF